MIVFTQKKDLKPTTKSFCWLILFIVTKFWGAKIKYPIISLNFEPEIFDKQKQNVANSSRYSSTNF